MIISQSVTSFPCRAERHTQPHTMWPLVQKHYNYHVSTTHTQLPVPSVQTQESYCVVKLPPALIAAKSAATCATSLHGKNHSPCRSNRPKVLFARKPGEHSPGTVFSLTTGQPLFALPSESTVITNDNRISDESVGQGAAANLSAEHGVGSPRSVVEVWCWPSACLEG